MTLRLPFWGFPCLFALWLAPPLAAHPHVFVDTGLDLVLDEAGQVIAVDVTWTYDDFFTLLIFEDMGLDPDRDGVLNGAELVRLKGFDLIEWPDGFEGDLYLTQNDTPVPLALPKPLSIAVEEGRIVATHRRSLEPVDLQNLVVRQFDPTYFVAYSVQSFGTPTGCDAFRAPANPSDADQALAEALQTDEVGPVDLGIHFADTFTLTCLGGDG